MRCLYLFHRYTDWEPLDDGTLSHSMEHRVCLRCGYDQRRFAISWLDVQ